MKQLGVIFDVADGASVDLVADTFALTMLALEENASPVLECLRVPRRTIR